MTFNYVEGHRVKIVPLIDSRGMHDPQIKQYVNEIGTVIKSYCVTRDEMPGVEKMLDAHDVYFFHVRIPITTQKDSFYRKSDPERRRKHPPPPVVTAIAHHYGNLLLRRP